MWEQEDFVNKDREFRNYKRKDLFDFIKFIMFSLIRDVIKIGIKNRLKKYLYCVQQIMG